MNPGFSLHVELLPYMEQQGLYNQFDQNQLHTALVNQSLSSVRVNGYFCPSFDQVRSVGDPANEGPDALGMHYYGIAGPLGQNPFNNTQYQMRTIGSQGNQSLAGMLFDDSRMRLTDVKDGTSNTFMVGEISWDWQQIPGANNPYRTWLRGCSSPTGRDRGTCVSTKNINTPLRSSPFTAGNFNNVSFGSEHPGGANFVMGDASVRFVRENIPLETLMAASSRNGQEIINLDE